MMKRFAACLLALLLCIAPSLALTPLGPDTLDVAAPSAILMEKQTGAVLYEKNAYVMEQTGTLTFGGDFGEKEKK